jgi:aldehyde:ferredoxin oxidoreductase
MGADHTSGYCIATNILKVGGYVDPLKKEGQVELSRNLQIATAAVDVTALGKSILKAERAFNAAAGFTNAHDRLPEFFEYEPCPPHNAVWDFTPEEIDEVYNF